MRRRKCSKWRRKGWKKKFRNPKNLLDVELAERNEKKSSRRKNKRKRERNSKQNKSLKKLARSRSARWKRK